MVSLRHRSPSTAPGGPGASSSSHLPPPRLRDLPPAKQHPLPTTTHPRTSRDRDTPDLVSPSARSSRRNLVLFFDGTGQAFGPTVTNIPALFSLASLDPNKQLTYYQAGIGTSIQTYESPFAPSKILNRIGQILDAGVAWSLGTHVQKGYQFLMNHYQPGDAIFLFGFSRGAFTARALAGMLQQVGLLPAGNDETVALAYSIYKRAADTPLSSTETLAEGFKKTFSRSVEVEFVGVFDTVSSVGALWPRTLPFAAGSRSTHHFRQALALDECRARYTPQPWVPDYTDDITTVKEVWFVGSHSNVGGGEFSYDGDTPLSLSHLPLRWMIREAVEQGLELDAARVEASPLYGPYLQTAKAALEGMRDSEVAGNKRRPSQTQLENGLRAFLHWTKEKNPDVDEVVAACVYLASLPSARTAADALAPRANHLGLRIEARPAAQGLLGAVADWASRVAQRAVALGWWVLELSPTPKVVWDTDGKRRRWKIRSNLGCGRLLPLSPSFHSSVRDRLSAPSSDLTTNGNNANYPEGKRGYVFSARFRRGRGWEDVKWVE
ncbi:hypothetical protein JCM8097_007106 [Rhodosporidiobolus ruineniae]